MSSAKLDTSGLIKNIRIFGERMEAGVIAILKAWITQCETEARTGRPWQDRTGNARQGLMGFVAEDRAGEITAYLTTQMDYGLQLETKGYDIIIPTLMANYPDLVSGIETYIRNVK